MHAKFALFLTLSLLAAPAVAQETAPEPPAGEEAPQTTIAWAADLPTAMAEAKKVEKPIMICINAKQVDGRTREEPAAKALREIIYLDERVVEKSKQFVCVFLTPKGGVAEYDELRELGIDGEIISPQHIFISPEGDKILLRREYWTHGRGEGAVKALVGMMDRALSLVVKPGEGGGAAPSGADKAGWIAKLVERIRAGGDDRDGLLRELVAADEGGDCTAPLIAMLPELKKEPELAASVIRALGRDGLLEAAPPIAEYLDHKEDAVRGNAAVSLEYIGSTDKKVVDTLIKRMDREKVEGIANHIARALGRCGVGESKARKALLKLAGGAKSEFASYGPCIGLAYFEGDEKAAAGMEKLLKQLGIPGGRRGGGTNVVKRGVVTWTIAEIGVPKSAKFLREEMVAGLENVKAFWVPGLVAFWEAAANACEGDEEAKGAVNAGVRRFVEFAQRGELERYGAETDNLMDEYRIGREDAGFEPKGDGLLGG